MLRVGSPARAPVLPASLAKKPRKTVIIHGGVWEFDAASQDPGNLKLQQNRRFPRLIDRGVWEFSTRAPGARCDLGTYPQVIHRVIHMGEFGSFTETPPCVSSALVGQTYLLSPVQILSLALQPLLQLVFDCVS